MRSRTSVGRHSNRGDWACWKVDCCSRRFESDNRHPRLVDGSRGLKSLFSGSGGVSGLGRGFGDELASFK